MRLMWLGSAVVAAGLASTPVANAQSSGFLDALFGLAREPAVSTVGSAPAAKEHSSSGSEQSSTAARPHPTTGGGGHHVSYCVRLCDGRYFPINYSGPSSRMTAIQICNALCPATPTQIYYGSSIEQAIGQNGKRYSSLSTAFVYRERIVPACTCKSNQATGTEKVEIGNDPTLRPGDIIVSDHGRSVYARPERDLAASTLVEIR